MSLMVENGVAVNLLIYAVTSVLNSVILALSHRCIVLLVGLVRLGLMRVSISTVMVTDSRYRSSFRDNILKLLDKHVPHKQTRS